MRYSYFLLIITVFSAMACNDKKLDTKKVAEQLNDRKIKRITEGEISNASNLLGDSIVRTLDSVWYTRIKNSLNHQDYTQASKDCEVEKYLLKDSLEEKFAAQIKRVSPSYGNEINKPNQLESRLIEAYKYNLENKLALNSNIQLLDNEYILYTSPIVLKNEMCLSCHGVLDKTISPTRSIQYKKGDLIGIWSIKLSRKEVAKSIK